MLVMLAMVGLVSAGPRKAKGKESLSADSESVSIQPEFVWPEARSSCPVESKNSGLIQSKRNEVIRMDRNTRIYVQHKVDVDSVEDRCINMVRIEHRPERGCKYTMIFEAQKGATELQLSTLDLHADSWCPGWRDWRETGESGKSTPYSRRMNTSGFSLQLSRTHVPDAVADRSCTDLAIRADGKVVLAKSLGGRPEPFLLDRLAFVGEYDSVGKPDSICPEPKKVVVQKVEVHTENHLKNTALLVYLAHEPVPNFLATDGGVSVLQQIGPRVTARGDFAFGPLGHNAASLNVMTGPVTDSGSLRLYVGGRLGAFEDLRGDAFTAVGANLGVETNRNDRSSPWYASLELTPVLYSAPVPNYIDGSAATESGVMLKLTAGVFLRQGD